MFKMASFTQLLLLGCLFRFGTSIKSKNIGTTYPRKTPSLTCKYKIGILFANDKSKTQMADSRLSVDIVQGHVFVGLIEKAVIAAKEKGVNCIFDNSTYMLTCCGEGNLEKFSFLDKMELTSSQKFWGHDISNRDFIFLLVNLFFFTFIMTWGFVLTNKYLVASEHVGQTENIEMT